MFRLASLPNACVHLLTLECCALCAVPADELVQEREREREWGEGERESTSANKASGLVNSEREPGEDGWRNRLGAFNAPSARSLPVMNGKRRRRRLTKESKGPKKSVPMFWTVHRTHEHTAAQYQLYTVHPLNRLGSA